ncbi:MAG TPA: MFS transporter [Solirubrobacteraceae bacterium]|nr:MFS transporter [Solirubrobacteraceae bacterium]
MTPAKPIRRWRAFALLAVSYFMTCVDLTVVNVSLPTIGRDLHFSATGLQWVVSAYALGYGGFLLLGGRIADLFGRRRVLMSALGVFAAASLGCALAPSDTVLIAGRAIQGLGAAVMLPTAMSIVTGIFEAGPERNKALGIWGALGATGGTIGLLTGGLITRYLGWQYIFYLNVPIGTVALGLVPGLLPRDASRATNRRFDLPGALVGTGGLVVLADAISQSPLYGWGAARTVTLLAAAVALLAAFLVIENRTESPMLPLSIFRLPTLTGALAAGLLIGASFFAFLFVGTLYMQDVLHYSSLQTGLAWMSGSVPSIVFAAVSQRLVTRHGPKVALAIGVCLVASGVIWGAQTPLHGHFLANLAGPFALAGAGTAFSFIPISIAVLAGVRQHHAGLASGLMNTSIQLGAALGIALASSVAASHTQALAHSGSAASAALAAGYRHALWVLGAIALLALPAIFALIRRNHLDEQPHASAAGAAQPALVPAEPIAA